MNASAQTGTSGAVRRPDRDMPTVLPSPFTTFPTEAFPHEARRISHDAAEQPSAEDRPSPPRNPKTDRVVMPS
ncbi:hypothetical protein [Pseudomonas sp. TUM22785]|uniref:hypothetical protein n=1 Tax=Pseudomonas sp. TUM22785 TaxID=3019098 RepID=UPI0023058869|nr:hypothetical protein [Pseudomonas sp. TUM22785]WCD82650.1 hypothetical protein PI990_11720 [Pseudomonas sp. TUM22785]